MIQSSEISTYNTIKSHTIASIPSTDKEAETKENTKLISTIIPSLINVTTIITAIESMSITNSENQPSTYLINKTEIFEIINNNILVVFLSSFYKAYSKKEKEVRI